MTDDLLITAQPHSIIRRDRESKLRKTLSRIEQLINEYDVGEIVVGLPLNMDDTMGERAEKCLEFAEMLRNRTGLPVVMQDERLSTEDAIEIMNEAGIPREERKEYVDSIAASVILRDYLNQRN